MAKSDNTKYEGYKEYPKLIGPSDNRILVNDEHEEARVLKEFGAGEDLEPVIPESPKLAAWGAKDSKKS